MLNKILSNLPFNTDYLKVLKEYQVKQAHEKLIRGAGFFFIVAALVVQLVAFAPVSSNVSASDSANDILPGGVSSQAEIVSDCASDYHYAAVLYAYYGVTCTAISQGSVVSLKSTADNDTLWSVGHLPYAIAGETPVNVLGATVYWRLLHGWDTGAFSTYTALQVTASNGSTFYILFTCGNLVSIGFPVPYTPPVVATPTPVISTPPAETRAPVPTPTPTKVVTTPSPTPTPVVVVPVTTVKPCQYNGSLPANSPLCKPCPAYSKDNGLISCLSYSKAASNVTQGIANANNTNASPGDVIQYTLSTTNNGQVAYTDYSTTDNLSTVLDYATIDNDNGATIDSSDNITWPPVTIAPGATITDVFTVQVKNPLPQIAENADGNYDNQMVNAYGNTITINVPPSVVVSAVNTAETSLPNTGPGTGIFVMCIIAVVVGYFYSRSRLLNKEAVIAEIAVGGE
jgi:uncharacterized repeat protein (TIGR01451 family)